jgi:hypothetical protein
VDNLVGLDAEGKVMHDAFINGVKEADFLRNGTARGIMGMSKNESVGLWKAVEERRLYCLHFTPSVCFLMPEQMTSQPLAQSTRSYSMLKELHFAIYLCGSIFHRLLRPVSHLRDILRSCSRL